MRNYVSEIIRRARLERGLTRQALIDCIGEHAVSYSTLKRLESGKRGIDDNLTDLFLNYFGLELKYKLLDEAEEQIMKEGLKEQNTNINECIERINEKIQEHRMVFHGESYPPFDYHVRWMGEFIIYLSMIPRHRLYDSLLRIGGHITTGRGLYILDQVENLYNSIPDSEIKDVADRLVECSRNDVEPSVDDLNKYYRFLENKANAESRLFDSCKMVTEIENIMDRKDNNATFI